MDLISELGIFPRRENGSLFQYSYLENPINMQAGIFLQLPGGCKELDMTE